MPHYEYRLLEVSESNWDKAQDSINQIARDGFRYRDTIQKGQGAVVLVFEREAALESGDAWTKAAQTATTRGRINFGETKIDQTERKYPPEEED
jgi:hypothetical protein